MDVMKKDAYVDKIKTFLRNINQMGEHLRMTLNMNVCENIFQSLTRGKF